MLELCKGDARVRTWPGWHAVDIQRAVDDMPVSSTAPPLTRSLLKTAKDLCVGGYFFYDLFTVAVHYACIAGEGALRDWCIHQLTFPLVLTRKRKNEPLNTRCFEAQPDTAQFFELLCEKWRIEGFAKFEGRYDELVDFAVERGGIDSSERWWWENNAAIRNPLAHGSMTILLPAQATGALRQMILGVNKLFPDVNLLEHDAQVRTRLAEEVPTSGV